MDPHHVNITRIEGTVMVVNTYLVEGPSGVVIVDGQLTVSDAQAVREAIDELGQPVAGLLVTHPHPDHYAGAAVVLDGIDAPIVATAEVARIIERDDAEKDAIVGPMMGAEWPSRRRFPDRIVEPDTTVELGGLEFRVVELGPAESHADVMYVLDEHAAFIGDVAYHDMHAYLLDGHHREWLHVLERLQRELDPAAVLYVGHGEPAGVELLRRQAHYVRTFVDTVTGALDRDPATRHEDVVAAMRAVVDDERLLFLMELSIEPVADELRRVPR